MDGSRAVPVFRSLKVKITLFLAVLVAGLLALNWTTFQHVRTLLFHNLEERAIWSARNLAHDAWTAMKNQDFQELNTRASALLLQDDVVHVGITTNDGNLLFSLSSPSERQATVLPKFPRHSCGSERPLLHYAMLFDKQVMIISVPVFPIHLPAGPSTPDDMAGAAPCAGTLHLSMALETVDRRLSGMLLTFGLLCMYVLGIGMAGYLFAFRQYIRPLSQLNRTVQEGLQADFHAEPVSLISTSDDVGGLITTVSAFLKQVRQRMEQVREICIQLAAICHETVATANDVVTACQRQSASVDHLSSEFEAGIEGDEAIVEDSEQLVSSTEETLESTRKIEQMLNQSTSNLEDAHGQTSRK